MIVKRLLMCILDTIGEELNKDILISPIRKSVNYDILSNLFKEEDDNQDKIFSIIQSNLEDYLNFKSIHDYSNSHKKISSVNNIFEGRTISVLECSETNGIKAKFDSFFYLTLSMPSKVTESDSESESSESESESESSESSESESKTKSENEIESDSESNDTSQKLYQ